VDEEMVDKSGQDEEILNGVGAIPCGCPAWLIFFFVPARPELLLAPSPVVENGKINLPQEVPAFALKKV